MKRRTLRNSRTKKIKVTRKSKMTTSARRKRRRVKIVSMEVGGIKTTKEIESEGLLENVSVAMEKKVPKQMKQEKITIEVKKRDQIYVVGIGVVVIDEVVTGVEENEVPTVAVVTETEVTTENPVIDAATVGADHLDLADVGTDLHQVDRVKTIVAEGEPDEKIVVVEMLTTGTVKIEKRKKMRG